jgi:transcriptional regulator GlxA family with amidase domain
LQTHHPHLAHAVAGRTLEVGILLFPGVEVLDFAGPFEVFSVASRVALRDGLLDHPAFRVTTIAARPDALAARHGLQVIPAASFAEHPPLDLLIVPGGVVSQPLEDATTLGWIGDNAGSAAITASVCTGAFLLARLGLLDGLGATTHWEDLDELRASFPALQVIGAVPFVDHGHLLTSAGISAGIGMSLHLVGRVLGLPAAQATARQMQYDWDGEARA